MSARKLAVQLLDRTEQEKSYSNLLLNHALAQSTLEERDKRLCASLYYGVIERRITLDAVLSHYCKQPLRKLDGTVRNILRLGIYQLLYCDQIPARAAVDASVKLTRSCRKASASGFVNAVLRSFLRDDCRIPLPKQPEKAMAVEYAVPEWLLKKLLDAYGRERTQAFLADALQPAPRYIRRNPEKCRRRNWSMRWASASYRWRKCRMPTSCTPAISGICRNFSRAGSMCRISPRRSVPLPLAQKPAKRCWISALLRRKDLHHGTANAGRRKGARL